MVPGGGKVGSERPAHPAAPRRDAAHANRTTSAATGRPGRLRRAAHWTWKVVGLASFAALAYAVSLVMTVPATVVTEFMALPPQVTALYGSVWHGRASLDGGYSLSWEARPASLLTGRFASDVELRGPDTLVTGRATAGPMALALRDLTGRAGPGCYASHRACRWRPAPRARSSTWSV